jgi:hypothetical protein
MPAYAIDAEVLTLWDNLSEEGWIGCQHHIGTLYPMPGDERFDDDNQFINIPIFPKENGGVVRAGDIVWDLPVAWFQEMETRNQSQLQVKFDVKLDKNTKLSSAPKGLGYIIALQKAMYLEAFRPRKPLAVATFRRRLDIYGAFVRVAPQGFPHFIRWQRFR